MRAVAEGVAPPPLRRPSRLQPMNGKHLWVAPPTVEGSGGWGGPAALGGLEHAETIIDGGRRAER